MKSKQSWMGRHSKHVLSGILSLLAVVRSSTFAQASAPASAPPPTKQSTNTAAAAATPAVDEKAWGILREALQNENADKRAKAVRALGLLTGNVEAEKAAVNALQDKKPNVRMPAAAALGSRVDKTVGTEALP